MRSVRSSLVVSLVLALAPLARAAIVTQYHFDGSLLDSGAAGVEADTLTPVYVGGDGEVAFAAGVQGQAVRLDVAAGSPFVLTAPDSDDLNLATDWTLEAYVKPDLQNSGEWDRFWTKWGEGSNDWHWAFRRANNGEDFYMNGAQVFDASSGLPENSVPLNRWSHVAVVGDSGSGTIRGYLNGIEVVEGTYTEPIPGVSNMNFGNFAHNGASNGLQFTGLIDEAMIHDVAVDEAYLLSRAALVPGVEPPGPTAPPPTTGVVSYYTFDNTLQDTASGFSANSGTSQDDLVPRGGSANYEAGQVGQSLRLGVDVDDLTDLNAELSDDINLPATYTIEAWVKPTELSDSWQRLVLNWGSAEHSYHFAIRNNSGFTNAVSLFHGQDDLAEPNANGGTVVPDEWQHIAGVADGANLRVYLNGELVGTTPYDGSVYVSGAEGLGIGDSDTAISTIKYNGLLDDLAIWAVPLTGEQIRYQYQHGLLGEGALGGGTPGDFNGNSVLDAADIDLLSVEVRAGDNRPAFDLTGDQLVNNGDRAEWVEVLKYTYFGDANLDGEFNSTDFVDVFVAGKYEDNIAGNAGWAEGDWDGSGDFESSDFVMAFVGGGYELGPRGPLAVQPVPEPASLVLLLLGSLALRRTTGATRVASQAAPFRK